MFENVNTIRTEIDTYEPRHVNVRDLLSFDWQKKIKRYCFVKSEILSDFGDGNKHFSPEKLLKYYDGNRIVHAVACYQPEYFQTTYYATHLDLVGGQRFRELLQILKRNFNIYQKQRIIYWAYW